jgi:hypothetical protein
LSELVWGKGFDVRQNLVIMLPYLHGKGELLISRLLLLCGEEDNLN